jgi:membrane-associated phospholipid phosphatase
MRGVEVDIQTGPVMRAVRKMLLLGLLFATAQEGWAQTVVSQGHQQPDTQSDPLKSDASRFSEMGADPENRLSLPALRHIVNDQRQFWSSPRELRKPTAWKTFLPFVGLTAALIAGDRWMAKQVPLGQVRRSQDISNYALFSLVGAAAGSYAIGQFSGNDRLRETGFLSGEAALNSTLIAYAFKEATMRQRPDQGNGNGSFWRGGSSFPSEHSAIAWSVASVVAHEYPGPLTKILAYTLASTVTLTRVTGKQHFPSDVFVGSALGWYLARQIFRAHHDPELGGASWDNHRDETEDRQSGWSDNGRQSNRGAGDSAQLCEPAVASSPYIPVDSWVYPAVLRLYSLGFVDTVYLGMRPWTRASVDHMLEEADIRIEDAETGAATHEAQGIYEALTDELRVDAEGPCPPHHVNARIESVYSVERAISGTPLMDSYHLGSTIINDYGRPYQIGFNDYSGTSGYASAGRFLVYVRGEFEGAPSGPGYSTALSNSLTLIDGDTNYLNMQVPIPLDRQATIPAGPIAAVTPVRLIEAYASVHFLNHEISFGKQDDWLGPGVGGGMAYSNNAENIYSFRINRVEPLYIPFVSRLIGPLRYDFLVGPLKGHTYPIDPWVHVEKISFRPTENLEFGFQRTVIWGGADHEPVNCHTFLRSFFSSSAAAPAVKNSPADPGARFGAFDFSYRLPFVRHWLTLYTDSEVHDDISPIDAPRRAAYRPGLYLSHVPGIPKLDIRVEVADTDPSSSNRSSRSGQFMYYETIERQGYTNNGQMFGDWIGREDKGGQGWITYHLSGDEWIQVGVRNQKATTYFIPGGTTLNDIHFQLVKRIGRHFELNGNFAYEHWEAPIFPSGTPTYPANRQTVTTTTIQLTWFPKTKISF